MLQSLSLAISLHHPWRAIVPSLRLSRAAYRNCIREFLISFVFFFTGALNETRTELCNEMNFRASSLRTEMLERRATETFVSPAKLFSYLRNYFGVSLTATRYSLYPLASVRTCTIILTWLQPLSTFYINFSRRIFFIHPTIVFYSVSTNSL